MHTHGCFLITVHDPLASTLITDNSLLHCSNFYIIFFTPIGIRVTDNLHFNGLTCDQWGVRQGFLPPPWGLDQSELGTAGIETDQSEFGTPRLEVWTEIECCTPQTLSHTYTCSLSHTLTHALSHTHTFKRSFPQMHFEHTHFFWGRGGFYKHLCW